MDYSEFAELKQQIYELENKIEKVKDKLFWFKMNLLFFIMFLVNVHHTTKTGQIEIRM